MTTYRILPLILCLSLGAMEHNNQLVLLTKDNYYISIDPQELKESALINNVHTSLNVPFNKQDVDHFLRALQSYADNKEEPFVGAYYFYSIAHFLQMSDKKSIFSDTLKNSILQKINDQSLHNPRLLLFEKDYIDQSKYKLSDTNFVSDFLKNPYCSVRCSDEIIHLFNIKKINPSSVGYKTIGLGNTFYLQQAQDNKHIFSTIKLTDYATHTSSILIFVEPIKAIYQDPYDADIFFFIDKHKITKINSSGVSSDELNFIHPLASLDYDCVTKKWITINTHGDTGYLYLENNTWIHHYYALQPSDNSNHKDYIVALSPDKRHVVVACCSSSSINNVQIFRYDHKQLEYRNSALTNFGDCIHNIQFIDNGGIVMTIIDHNGYTKLQDFTFAWPQENKFNTTFIPQKIFQNGAIDFGNHTLRIKENDAITFELNNLDDVHHTPDGRLLLVYKNDIYSMDCSTLNRCINNISQNMNVFELICALLHYNAPLIDQSDFLKDHTKNLSKALKYFNNCSAQWMQRHITQ